VISEGFVRDYPLSIRHISGQTTDVLYNATVYRNEADKVQGVFAAARDITERKKTEEALKESEERYRSFFENSIDAVLLTSPDGEILKANAEACRIFDRTEEELCKVGRDGVVDVSDPRLPAALEERIRTGKFKAELTFLRRDGTKFPGEISSAVFKDKGGLIRTSMTIRDITERKRAEEALRESEDRNRDLVENSQDLMCTHDLQGNFLSVNPAPAKLLGYDQSTILNMNVRDILAPEVRNQFSSYLDTIQEKGFANGLMLVQTAAGERRVLEYNNTLRTEGVSSPIVRSIAHDITERWRAEQALRESEEKYRVLVETSPDAITLFDLNLNIIMGNRPALSLYGYERQEEIIGKSVLNYLAPEQLARAREDIAKVLETGSMGPVEYTLLRQDGTFFVAELKGSLILDREKKPNAILCVSRDITGRKKVEEALRSSEEKYRTILETMEDGYFEVDLTGNFTFVNDAECRNLGYSREELIGRNNRQYTDETMAKKLHQTFTGVYTTGESVKMLDVEVIKKDGTKSINEISISLIKDSEGKPIGFRGVARDVTERKHMEQEKASLEEQLRQSQKIEAIGRLAGGVAHDFNNLLTVISGNCQLSLLELNEKDPLKGNIEEIKGASEKAANLTRQLLAFSRRQILEMKVLDLNTVLRDLDKMLHRLIGEDIELITLLADDLGRVKTDPGWVEQIIMNLAVNARDAMPNGGKLTIETANVELDEAYARNHVSVKPGRYVMLSMSDTGVGMTPEVRQQIFEPFFTTKEKGKGTGLGLSTVYGIVKQSGGNIWVYSELGKGTTLKIYLPCVDEPAEKLKAQVLGEEFPRGSETILIVEDDKEVRNLAVRILKRQGYTVLDGSYGDEAFSACRQHKGPIHLLLTDVVMPGMDGRALSESLSQLHPEMKVLYMSGYTDDAIVRHGVMAKGINYIQKPFTVSELTNKVREVLNKSS
jgi:PAS domain S-box-containing protein